MLDPGVVATFQGYGLQELWLSAASFFTHKNHEIIFYSNVGIKRSKTQAVSSDLKIKLKHDKVSRASLGIVPTVPNGDFCLDWDMKSDPPTHTPLPHLELSSSSMSVSCFLPFWASALFTYSSLFYAFSAWATALMAALFNGWGLFLGVRVLPAFGISPGPSWALLAHGGGFSL